MCGVLCVSCVQVIVRMIADIEKVPLDAAEDKYCNWHSQVAASTEEDE